ncbi:hypothetical protein HPB50_009283 [Hyalomma asiaticum]|uniref:Uncharacterized protein n=1 Tax=Hyalomma asiaticum TaxID=266040 RepID=A0ACB7THJ0_HYAAI|nr:hypothetical protein HPB50_009283 [Hyalomma asiaticum]
MELRHVARSTKYNTRCRQARRAGQRVHSPAEVGLHRTNYLESGTVAVQGSALLSDRRRRSGNQVQSVSCLSVAASEPSAISSTVDNVVYVGAPTLVWLRGEAGSQGEKGVGGPALGCMCRADAGERVRRRFGPLRAPFASLGFREITGHDQGARRRLCPPSPAASSPLLFLVRVVPTWRKVRVVVQRRPTPLSRSSRATHARVAWSRSQYAAATKQLSERVAFR